MADEDPALETDLGRATIVYEDPNEGTTEKAVPNEHVAYFQDHWIVKMDEDEEGHDVVRRIPARRVHYVERSVEEFEREVRTLRDQVESFAADLRTKLPVGGGGGGGERDAHRIDVGSGGGDEGEIDGDAADEPADGSDGERRPGSGRDADVDDPRRTSEEGRAEAAPSEAALADEPGEAVGPDAEQAQPVQTEGTEPELTPEEDDSRSEAAASGAGTDAAIAGEESAVGTDEAEASAGESDAGGDGSDARGGSETGR